MNQQTRPHGAGWGTADASDATPSADGGWGISKPTQNLNVLNSVSLVCPRQVRDDLPITPATHHTVIETRQVIQQIIRGSDRRMLVIVGPCSIHDETAALEYAQRLTELRRRFIDRLFIVMRVYFEKPRTTVGWKGLINDPFMDGSFNIDAGLRKARGLLLKITEMGMPAGTEMLEPITPQYIADLVTWASIGARTIESQTHRQMASGLSMPVGFKNGTSGNLDIAVNAMKSARQPHSFLGIDDQGRTAVIKTRGNQWGHLILRGGRSGPNYDPQTVAEATAALAQAGLCPGVMVDCSHANSGKRFQNQQVVAETIVRQRAEGNEALMGLLIESHLFEGNQPMADDPAKLRYGVSVTDECLGWEHTEGVLAQAHQTLGA